MCQIYLKANVLQHIHMYDALPYTSRLTEMTFGDAKCRQFPHLPFFQYKIRMLALVGIELQRQFQNDVILKFTEIPLYTVLSDSKSNRHRLSDRRTLEFKIKSIDFIPRLISTWST